MKTCCMILLAAFTSLASAQQNDVTIILEVLDVTNGRRTVVKEFPYRVEAPNGTPDGQWLVYNSGGKLYKRKHSASCVFFSPLFLPTFVASL